jgi:hypothetical protein
VYLLSLRKSVLPEGSEEPNRPLRGRNERTPLLSQNAEEPARLTADSFSGHSQYTTILFALSFLAVLLPLMPSILFILTTRRSPPSVPLEGHIYQYLAKVMSSVGVMGMFISAGLIRRRPEMRFNPPKLGAGFGLRAGVYDDPEAEDEASLSDTADTLSVGGKNLDRSRRGGANVLDYDGCCLFSFIFVGYVSLGICLRSADLLTWSFKAIRIGLLSMKKERLDIADLPHLPYANRAENMRLTSQGTLFVPYASTPSPDGSSDVMEESIHTGDLEGGKIGALELAKYLYRGKYRIILDCKSFSSFSTTTSMNTRFCLRSSPV